jgi:cell division protein WhiA
MTGAGASFTDAVRQELARCPIGEDDEVRAELAAILRLAGSLTLGGGGGEGSRSRRTLEVATMSGAVARRTFGLLQHRFGVRPELLVRAPAGVRRRSTYGVRVPGAGPIARDLGVLDADGRPLADPPPHLEGGPRDAYLRGAVLAAGSLSAPGRPPHLEVAVRSRSYADGLAELIREAVGGTATATGDERPRVVLKSGATIGELLAAVGAVDARTIWEDRRTRRRLRNDANRLANADAANLRRTIEAASAQVRAVERVVGARGWEALDDELRAVALARLANPAASLTELGELVDPPIGKSAVHRRLRRLEDLDPAADGDGPRGV